jgi:gliding motility-associated-like protein
MNRNTYLFFVKSIVALFILLFSNNLFALTYVAAGSGNFNEAKTWGETLDPSLTSGENFTIEGNKTINVTSNLSIGTLTINSGATLKIITTSDIIISIDSLFINDSGGLAISTFDFGTKNVEVTITTDLNGAAFSIIQHNPDPGKTQQLILKGFSNKIASFLSPGKGTSIVSYSRKGNQSVFNSKNYQNLELLESGIKTLNNPSPGEEATVNNALTIKGCKLRIPHNFNYLGTESNLEIIDGWINTDGSGYYSSTSKDAIRTFPVGDASKMQTFSLTNIANITVSVRFGGNTITSTIPNSGLDAWYVIATKPTSTTVSIKSESLLASSSNIAAAPATPGAIWKIQGTTYTPNNKTFSTKTTFSLTNETTLFGIFDCPTFKLYPGILPAAAAGSTYNQTVEISNGTSPYSLVSSSSTPSVYKVTASGTKDELKITGTAPTSSAQSVALSFTIQDATGCQSTLSATVNTTVQTTWDGKKWSGVEPNGKTPNVTAIIAADYSTAENGKIKADNIIIQAKASLIVFNTDTVAAADSIKNFGKLIGMCGSEIIRKSLDGNTIEEPEPEISPVRMNTAILDQPYSETFSVYGDTKPEFKITNYGSLPTNAFDSKKNTLNFTPSTTTAVTFEITYNQTGCVTTKTRTIKIIDLPSPGLAILNIGPKTFGDADFKVRTYSRSTGKITYEIISGNTCAKINDTSGVITILGAGPSPQNIIVVRATQTVSLPGTTPYKAETATETFVIKPADGRFIVRNNAFILGQSKAISVYSKVDKTPVLSFDQLSGSTIAELQPGGIVKPLQTGTFSVLISMAANNNHTAFDSIYTFNVITLQIPPVAVTDTIVLEMGKDTTVNILDNDMGMTEDIDPAKTDIDIENIGIQPKFYSTEIGNFLIDPDGNLTILPFSGFIGSGRLAYSVADINGLRSEVAYVEIIVNPPVVIPPLKANTAMSPNGDNLNDALVIANTDLNNENTLVILDETGNTVYETTNYQNNWEGINTKNDKLEPGTYFYIFKEKNSGRELKNYIQIVH